MLTPVRSISFINKIGRPALHASYCNYYSLLEGLWFREIHILDGSKRLLKQELKKQC